MCNNERPTRLRNKIFFKRLVTEKNHLSAFAASSSFGKIIEWPSFGVRAHISGLIEPSLDSPSPYGFKGFIDANFLAVRSMIAINVGDEGEKLIFRSIVRR